jgi:hypothetical protein
MDGGVGQDAWIQWLVDRERQRSCLGQKKKAKENTAPNIRRNPGMSRRQSPRLAFLARYRPSIGTAPPGFASPPFRSALVHAFNLPPGSTGSLSPHLAVPNQGNPTTNTDAFTHATRQCTLYHIRISIYERLPSVREPLRSRCSWLEDVRKNTLRWKPARIVRSASGDGCLPGEE